MNIFEDLIEELKEENLIEQTVTETSKSKKKLEKSGGDVVKADASRMEQSTAVSENAAGEKDSPETVAGDSLNQIADEEARDKPANDANFYRQKAMEEVSFLQMVESAFAGVEREQMKIVPKPYDDLKVKKVLHAFLQAASDPDSNDHAKAQFHLLQETESWHSSLALRDGRMMTANLRRYCETSRPPLSSPALIALARFYRNSPYSEQVRSKFDLVITRLFSKETGGSHREMLFSRDELVAHLKELYADWSSIPFYATEADDAEMLATVEKFEGFMKEADDAISFDDLVENEFFNRLHIFKEAANENFYAPVVTAAAIETNVRIGNQYVELVRREKEIGGSANLENKYGLLNDNLISEATSKTLSLVELLNQKKPEPPPVEEKPVVKIEPKPAELKIELPIKVESGETGGASNANKWLFLAAALAILIMLGLYFGTKSNSSETKQTPVAAKMSIENSLLREYLQEARIQDATLNGVVLPSWNSLTDDKKKEVLKQMFNLGGAKGYTKVRLVDEKGKPAGSAENGNVSLIE